MADDQTPKIIVDDDWKSQARREKERLAADASPAGAGDAAAGASAEGTGQGRKGPLGFDDLVGMLATQALMYLGAFPDPQTGRAVVSLEVAKAHIDLLGVLEEKTKGNLTDEESKRLGDMLREIRGQFVEISRAVAQAQAEGRISADGVVSPGEGSAGPGGTAGGFGGGTAGGMGAGPFPGQPGG